MADDSWKLREYARFADGTYQPVPWHREMWWSALIADGGPCADHFAHVSQENPEQLAFTPDAAKGAIDRQTRMKPGRYLARYVPEMDPCRVTYWAGRWAALYAPTELLFAHTPDEIEHVYTHGPSSCMSKTADAYASPEHPVRVYGAGDLAVAYLADDPDHITARAVVWPDKKLHTRIYGDIDRLQAALERAGYSKGSFEGARILRVPTKGDGFVCPYFDGDEGVNDCGDELRVSNNPEYVARSIEGVTCPTAACDHCGERGDESDFTYYEAVSESLCQSCADSLLSHCEYCEEYDCTENVSYFESVEMSLCQGCVDNHFTLCEHRRCENLVRDHDAVHLGDDTVVCTSCADDHCGRCEGCENLFEAEQLTDAGRCPDCAADEPTEGTHDSAA